MFLFVSRIRCILDLKIKKERNMNRLHTEVYYIHDKSDNRKKKVRKGLCCFL